MVRLRMARKRDVDKDKKNRDGRQRGYDTMLSNLEHAFYSRHSCLRNNTLDLWKSACSLWQNKTEESDPLTLDDIRWIDDSGPTSGRQNSEIIQIELFQTSSRSWAFSEAGQSHCTSVAVVTAPVLSRGTHVPRMPMRWGRGAILMFLVSWKSEETAMWFATSLITVSCRLHCRSWNHSTDKILKAAFTGACAKGAW